MEGKRYWLIYPNGRRKDNPIYQLWEDGRIDMVGVSESLPCYINGTLFSYDENAIIVSKYAEGKFEVLRKIPNEEDLHFGWYFRYRMGLANSPV